MTTIAQIIREGKGKAGSGGAWRVEKAIDSDPYLGTEYELWHYSTLMLRWARRRDANVPLYASTGHGSVSDQGGMNTAFKILGLPYHFDRAGGARITDLTGGWPESSEDVYTSHDSMRWTPNTAEHEIAEWRKILDS